jgi:hypothetical protein
MAVALTFAIYTSLRPRLSRDEEASLRQLDWALETLEHPTKANRVLRGIMCTDSSTQAKHYAYVRRRGIEEKVERYLSLCAHDDSPRMELPK